jgi:hypothetical protein
VSERASHRFLFVGTGGRDGWFGVFGFLFRIACYLAMRMFVFLLDGVCVEFMPGCQVPALAV